ncbi:MAG: Rpn family recombination-promoting nuclease/putative transposase [Candidatus Riflebacteria bacterium]|nr:Rpn family recombination-promoting nuclease/putative transposase [Candidatus Riflebacteria bacterium]
MPDHDHSYKKLFSHPKMVEDLLRGFVHGEWVDQLDFSTLEPFPSEHVTDCFRDRRDDIIWRIRWKENWLYIYLLLEFQSSVDPYMAVRIMAYLGLLYQDIIQTETIKPGEKLPPVLPVVLYNGFPRWDAPTDIFDQIGQTPRGLEKFSPRLSYLILDEGAIADSELTDLHNCVTALIRLEKSHTGAEIMELIAALSKWLSLPAQASLRRAFGHWIGRVILKDRIPEQKVVRIENLEEAQRMLAETVAQWPMQWKAEGKAEGKAEERADIVSKLIEKKFGKSAKDQFLSNIKNYKDEDFDKLCEKILFCDSPEELFK